MFSRKKKAPVQKSGERSRGPVNFGIPGIPGFDPSLQDDDDDLEAELLALTGGRKEKCDDLELNIGDDGDDDLEMELSRILGGNARRANPTSVRQPQNRTKERNPVLGDILKDSVDDTNSDEDIDENDPDLLGELQLLTCEDEEDEKISEEAEGKKEEDEENVPSQREQLKSRLDSYREAEKHAKASNELARARRFNRGVKSLEKLVKRAEQGEVVPFDEIPPEIIRPVGPAASALNEPAAQVSSDTPTPHFPEKIVPIPSNLEIEDVGEQKNKSMSPAFSKEIVTGLKPELLILSGEEKPVVNDMKVVVPEPTPQVQCDSANPRCPAVSTQNLSIMDKLKARRDHYRKLALAEKNAGNKTAALACVKSAKIIDGLIAKAENGEIVSEDQIPSTENPVAGVSRKPVPPALATRQPGILFTNSEVFTIPKTVSEALNQRLKYYEKMLKKSETTGLRNEAKKCADIVRIYQNAIRLHQRGSNVPFEKLPTPPGCPPIPLTFKI